MICLEIYSIQEEENMTGKTYKTIRNILCLLAVIVFIALIMWDMISLTDLWPDKEHEYDTYLHFYISSRIWGTLAVSFVMSLIPLAPTVYFHIRYKKSKP